ncbi:hypothetical protein ACHAWF_005115 [Thalassiosira exigua]
MAPPPKPNGSDFELGQSIVYNDCSGNIEAVVYERACGNGTNHTISHKDGHKSAVHDHHPTHQHQMIMSNIPSTLLDYCKEVGKSLIKEEAQCLARPHYTIFHSIINKLFQLAKFWFLPKCLLKARDTAPLGTSCQFGTVHRHPWCSKGKKSGNIHKETETETGDGVSVDQIISSQPGLTPQMSGFLTSKQIWGCTTFVDHVSDYVYVHLTCVSLHLRRHYSQKLLGKSLSGKQAEDHYHADNGRFADNCFVDMCNDKDQTLTFCGVGAHHQNGIFENKNKILTQGAREHSYFMV